MNEALPAATDIQFILAGAQGLAEQIHVIDDPSADAVGFIVVHSTRLGPAMGGCRLWSYPDRSDALADALRLAKGMSFKNAIAGLPLGGGKAVLVRPEKGFDREHLFKAFGQAVERLSGSYVTAEDVGTTIADMAIIREQTASVAGLPARPGRAGGNPSPWTALGVFRSIQFVLEHQLKRKVAGAVVAVQGVGAVGGTLCRMLRDVGVNLVIADMDEVRARNLAKELNARTVGVDEIVRVQADIFAPCALGGILNENTTPLLGSAAVVGAANNQLATPADGVRLAQRGVLYAPDYVVNAGGIICAAAEYLGESFDAVRERVNQIPQALARVFEKADRDCTATNLAADTLALQVLAEGNQSM